MAKLSREIVDELLRDGREFTPERIGPASRLLSLLHEANGYRAPRLERDIAYGPDPRHRLDVHLPDTPADGLPVLLYVPGGGFVGGDKHDAESPYYDHLGGWAVRNGMVAVTMNYRLAPQHRWPAAAQDIAAALGWTRELIAGFGGDPRRIVLAGQSAGAAHVASFIAGHGGPGPDALAAAVMLSGIYDPASAEQNVLLHAYYGDDPDGFAERCALPGLVSATLPMLFGVAELDMPDFHRQAVTLLDAMIAARGVIPPFVTVPDHTHLSEILSLGLDDDAFGAVLARFVHGSTRTTRPANSAA